MQLAIEEAKRREEEDRRKREEEARQKQEKEEAERKAREEAERSNEFSLSFEKLINYMMNNINIFKLQTTNRNG